MQMNRIILFIGLITSGCKKDSVSHEEHTDAEGFVLEGNNGNIYREFQGVTTGFIALSASNILELTVLYSNS